MWQRKCTSPLTERNRSQGLGHRLRASEVVEFIHMSYFDGPKKLGNRHPKFMARISRPFICLIFATLQHVLQTYETGAFQDGDYFKHGNKACE